MAVKYKYDFKTFDGHDCEVRFDYSDYTGEANIIRGGLRAFVLREFNNDNDIFKPIRATQAEMEVLANPYLRLDDFIRDEDDIITVEFYFNGSLFWKGYLLQDDFQEEWTDTDHIITLRASEGFGQIDSNPPTFLRGQNSFIYYLTECLNPTILSEAGLNVNGQVICNLFYPGISNTNDLTLQEVTVDSRTFQGDSPTTIIEKINRGWGQTIFQYYSKWHIMRIEDMLDDGDARYAIFNFLGFPNKATYSTKDYKVNIGPTEGIKPIAPAIIRTVKRKVKTDKVTYFYRFPDEIVCNQTFLAGDGPIIPTTDTYEIDCWTLLKTNFGSPSAGTADFYRKEEKDGDGNITDNYMFIESDSTLTYAKSEGLIVNPGDVIDMSFDFRSQRNVSVGPANIQAAAVLFEDGTDKYTLNDDGEWILSNSSYTTNFQFLNVSYTSTELLTEWKTKEVRSKAVPAGGTIYFCFVNNHGTDTDSNFRAFELEIRESSKQPGVIGDFDQYTKTDEVRATFEEETFLDDSNNRQHKGAIHYNGALTGDQWYRIDWNGSESLTFKRQKAIGHYLVNRRNFYRLDGTFLGLSWSDGGVDKPVWFHNKFILSDEPTKRFMITSLQEMDFVAGTWRATLQEVADTAIDSFDIDEYPTHSFGNIYERDV